MGKISKFNKAVIEAIKYDAKNHTIHDFNLREVNVKHQDGSWYNITHCKLVKMDVDGFPCILIYAEHNTPNLFVECDLDSVIVRPWKGRRYKVKLSK